ncbi:MAG: hypothetical protein D6725_14895 [Planctomycetota bacterium]|nr:MAG: hypothetical protein D6725_14895 [Planctomycetota bacterium]
MISSTGRWVKVATAVLAVVILVPSMIGFGTKLYEFVQVVRSDPDGVFALTPVTNYLLASAGFFFLLLWAAANGMFRDIERPKYEMLQQEEELDRRLH